MIQVFGFGQESQRPGLANKGDWFGSRRLPVVYLGFEARVSLEVPAHFVDV